MAWYFGFPAFRVVLVAVGHRKLEHVGLPTPSQRKKERQHKSAYIHVPTYWSLLQYGFLTVERGQVCPSVIHAEAPTQTGRASSVPLSLSSSSSEDSMMDSSSLYLHGLRYMFSCKGRTKSGLHILPMQSMLEIA